MTIEIELDYDFNDEVYFFDRDLDRITKAIFNGVTFSGYKDNSTETINIVCHTTVDGKDKDINYTDLYETVEDVGDSLYDNQ